MTQYVEDIDYRHTRKGFVGGILPVSE